MTAGRSATQDCPACKHPAALHDGDEWFPGCQYVYANTGKESSSPSGQMITSCGCTAVTPPARTTS